jgi:hypothetical protein
MSHFNESGFERCVTEWVSSIVKVIKANDVVGARILMKESIPSSNRWSKMEL